MLLLDLAAERRPDGSGWEDGSRLSTLPSELKWSEVRCRFAGSQAPPDRSWEEELGKEKKPQATEGGFQFSLSAWVGKIHWRKGSAAHASVLGLP